MMSMTSLVKGDNISSSLYANSSSYKPLTYRELCKITRTSHSEVLTKNGGIDRKEGGKGTHILDVVGQWFTHTSPQSVLAKHIAAIEPLDPLYETTIDSKGKSKRVRVSPSVSFTFAGAHAALGFSERTRRACLRGI